MKVSVITPTYNRQYFLDKCIQSYLSQLDVDSEMIVVNDGGEVPIVPEGITLYNIEHSTQSNAQNYGIEKATGDLICTLDDDDLFYDNYSLANRVKMFDNDTEVLWTNGIDIWEAGDFKCQHEIVDGSAIWNTDGILINSMMWRKSIKDKIGYWFDTDLSSNEDWDFKIRCVEECVCKCVDINTVKHRVHGDMRSSLHRESGELSINANKMMIKLREKYK